MVRTYAFNPSISVQSDIFGAGEQRTQKLLQQIQREHHLLHQRSIPAPPTPYVLVPQSLLSRTHSLPPQEQPIVNGWTSSPDNMNFAHVDMERQRRLEERQRANSYQQELKNQAIEQKIKRIQTDIDYGITGKEMLRNQGGSVEEPPWLRGNAQPTTGRRNAPGWQQTLGGQQPGPGLERQKSLPLNFSYGGSSNPYDYQQRHNQKSGQQRQAQQEQLQMKLNSLEQEKQRRARQPSPIYDPFGKGGGGAPVRDKDGRVVTDRRHMRKSWNTTIDSNQPHSYENGKPHESKNSFDNGYGGGMDFSYPGLGDYGLGTSNLNSNPYTNSSNNYGSYQPAPYQPPKQMSNNPTDAYKNDLMQQIEEKKRQREYEKQKQREEDERERIRIERDNARMRQQEDEEKKKGKAKEAAAEQRRFELAEKARQEQIERDKQARMQRRNGRVVQEDSGGGGREERGSSGLEWWEKKDSSGRGPPTAKSQVIPTMRGAGGARQPSRSSLKSSKSVQSHHSKRSSSPPAHANYDTYDTIQTGHKSSSRRSSSQSRQSRQSQGRRNEYQPSSASQRNEGMMRRLSAMREKLTKEQLKVRNALDRDNYGEEMFSDEDLPDDYFTQQLKRDPFAEVDNAPSLAKPRRSKSAYEDLFDSGSVASRQSSRTKRQPSVEEEDPIQVIRNSRKALESATSRKSRHSHSHHHSHSSKQKSMHGFLSDEEDY